MVTAAWPRITVVTPCYNTARFLESCIRSVLDQEYDALQYIVIDGGSTDGSVDVIRTYEPRLAYWHSRPDRGQAHAINQGLALATGDVVAYLNADDQYCAGTLSAVAAILSERPDVTVVFGDAEFIDEAGSPMGRYAGVDQPFERKLQYWQGWDVPQPTVFLRRRVLDRHGVLDESFQYALDYDWFLRIARTERFQHAGAVLAQYRLHSGSKTGDWASTKHRFHAECARAVRKHLVPWSAAYWRWRGARLRYRYATARRAALRRWRRASPATSADGATVR
jgi:glycosyltransferase involved in cell wall biosynthesis